MKAFNETFKNNDSRYGERRRQSSESSATPESHRRSSADSLESHGSVPNSDWLRAVENRLTNDTTSSSETSLRTSEDNTLSNSSTKMQPLQENHVDSKVGLSCNSCDLVPNIVIDSSQPCSVSSLGSNVSEDDSRRGSDVTPAWMISPELLALRHNLTFP